jgi:hypothetical protein
MGNRSDDFCRHKLTHFLTHFRPDAFARAWPSWLALSSLPKSPRTSPNTSGPPTGNLAFPTMPAGLGLIRVRMRPSEPVLGWV